MKKVLLLAAFCSGFSLAHSQTLSAGGAIVDSKNVTVGYYSANGAVQDSKHTIIGYINNDGTVQNSKHVAIGYLKTDGTLEDASHKAVGKAGDNKLTAIFKQFFFK